VRSLSDVETGLDKRAGVKSVSCLAVNTGAVAGLVGIRVGVVSGVINLESSGVEASDWRLRHEQAYHEA
jgi:hypothetical protein